VRKPIIIIIFLLVLALFAIFYISMQRDSAVIVVEVTLAESPDKNSEHIISQVNASVSYVGKMEVPKETPLYTPGITVVLIQDMQVRSGWYSTGIPVSDIFGNYTIMVKPFESLNVSRPFVINTRVLDPAGKDVSVRRTEVTVS